MGTTTTAVAAETTTTAAETTTTAAETTTTAAETTTTAAETTTTEAPTTTAAPTTTTIPTVGDGTYIIPDEVEPGDYRFVGYMARLDEDLEIIDNDIVSDNGLGLMRLLDTDAYVEISGEATPLEFLPVIDPIAAGFTEGTYLVGVDIEPGRYRISPVDGNSYWARLDANQEIIDNDISDGATIVIVNEGDWALTYSGEIELVP